MSDEQRGAWIEPVLPKQVGGFLLVLCLLLTIAYPAQSLYFVFVDAVPRLSGAHSPNLRVLFSVYSLLFSVLAVFSGVAGFSLWSVKRGAVILARRYLWTYLLTNFFYFCFWIIVMRPKQTLSFASMGWQHVVGPLGSFWLWYVYLEHSKRVRATYGEV
jgi:hypothetical protein